MLLQSPVHLPVKIPLKVEALRANMQKIGETVAASRSEVHRRNVCCHVGMTDLPRLFAAHRLREKRKYRLSLSLLFTSRLLIMSLSSLVD